ncbi:adhesion G- coupled receptor D1-like [Paramuricea clavata]|nr:adhesion G- coupled receptor D1-like [Paramuricea clavata]
MVVLQDTEVSDSNRVALDVIYYIGSALSLAGLFFSCIVYIVLYKDLQILTTSRHLVHLNLQIALGLTQIVFLAGGRARKDEVACKVVAILLHYFFLAGFTWILLESAMLYLKLISVYRGEFVRMKNFLLFGWGFPVLFVGLSASVKINAYGTDQWCWLSYKDGFLWVFFAPVLIIIAISLVTVIAVIRVLFIVSNSEQADAKKKIISAARGVVILFPILGFSWGFSVIAVNHDALVWKYLFAIFTSLQGFLIFLIYGVCNTEIRMAVGRKLGYGDVHPATSTT